jgi:hypothetical protein
MKAKRVLDFDLVVGGVIFSVEGGSAIPMTFRQAEDLNWQGAGDMLKTIGPSGPEQVKILFPEQILLKLFEELEDHDQS